MQSTTTETYRPFGWAHISPLRRERIEAGVKALSRIDSHVTFYDWRLVGEALVDLRESAREQAGANGYTGKAYNAAWARCVADNPDLVPLSKIDSSTRTHAMWLATHWDVVAEWHANLDDAHRRFVNHPATVRRRYVEDNPLPKPRRERDSTNTDDTDNSTDNTDNEEDLDADEPDESGANDADDAADGFIDLTEPRDVYDIEGAGRTDPDAPSTIEDWLVTFEDLWRRMPTEVRAEIAKRITLWEREAAELAEQSPADTTLIDTAINEVNEAVAKDKGAKVRNLARRKGATSLRTEPTPERMATVVEEALAKPIKEGEDIFAGLDVDISRQSVTVDQVRARKPKLSDTQAKIIAARLSHPDWTEEQIAEDTKRKLLTVVRTLRSNGF